MRKVLLTLSFFSVVSFGAKAQNPVAADGETRPAELTSMDSPAPVVGLSKKSSVSAPTIFWSEDFSSGIPSTWVNQGFDVDPTTGLKIPNPLTVWEYRGPSTSPSNSVGSRGAYAGPNTTGNQGAPIMSPTRANGFVIFDSDYLDDGGNRATPGGGVSPAPHIGTLTTDTIDLSAHPDVEIAFSSYARVFFAEFAVAVSDDGGLTFPDTAKFHMDLEVNDPSINGGEVAANISGLAGGKSNVVLRFIFDGTLGNANGSGYYFWMIDDIEVRTPPKHSVRFVPLANAPAHDIIFPKGYAKYGHLNLNQAVPINFDSNIYNYGSETLTNVRLKVEIEDATTGTNVTTLFSTAAPSVVSRDTLDFNSLKTNTSWTPSAVGTYDIIYSLESDSIPMAAESFTPMDTFTMRVTDRTTLNGRYSYDWGAQDNFVGTNSLVAPASIVSIGERFNFPNPSVDTTGFVFIKGMSVGFEDVTDPTATIIWSVYDTVGFSFGATGGPTGSPLWSKAFQLDASIPGTFHTFDFYDTLGNGAAKPLSLPSGEAYYFVMTMSPNSTGGVVRILNDQTFTQPSRTVIVQDNSGSWFGGFSNSDNLSSPILRLRIAEIPAYDIGLEAYEMQNAVNLYPNPTNGEKVSIEIAQGGAYTLEVVNLLGQVVYSEEIKVNGNDRLIRDFSQLSSGVYLMNISNDNFANSQKLTIEK